MTVGSSGLSDALNNKTCVEGCIQLFEISLCFFEFVFRDFTFGITFFEDIN